MKEKLYRFMYGRYGVDQFSRFLIYAALVPLAVGIFVRGWVCWALWLALTIPAYARVFSKNFPARRRENEQYLRLRNQVADRFRLARERWKQRKDFVFIRCPGNKCGATLRLPRGKGKLRVTCRKCGTVFEKKT